MKYDIVSEYAQRTAVAGNRRIVLRFGTRPVEVRGTDRVEGLTVDEAGERATIDTSIVLRAIGYRPVTIPGLPADPQTGVVSNTKGRVTRDGAQIPGLYVTGWVKRGPRGVIGTNRLCARETVESLLADAAAGGLPEVTAPPTSVGAQLSARGVPVVDWSGWTRIDRTERDRGAAHSRPRIKVVNRADLLTAAGLAG